jgi:outer membrane protein OmpA-like peptidoglycan-associated protein
MLMYDDEPLEEYEEDATTWIALADMMTGLMAIFLALSIAVLSMQQSKKDAIILAVSDNLTKHLKEEGISANIDEKTGRLIVSEKTNFGYGESSLKPEGKQSLDIIMPVYAKAIFGLTPEQQSRIDRIVIEGHTDRVGSYTSNMILSSQRANAILAHVDSMPDFAYKQRFLKKLTAVGRGENDASTPDEVANPDDRNVVIRFEFKEGDDQETSAQMPSQTAKQMSQMSSAP